MNIQDQNSEKKIRNLIEMYERFIQRSARTRYIGLSFFIPTMAAIWASFLFNALIARPEYKSHDQFLLLILISIVAVVLVLFSKMVYSMIGEIKEILKSNDAYFIRQVVQRLEEKMLEINHIQ
ncbi:hypothetical protein [Saccharibacillus sacchari]|uniref:Uncharacterized protein n=1 Tax=Saccharibacillus sacchari TaxID=456493 RepID=A0ACC6PHW8_9BACL